MAISNGPVKLTLPEIPVRPKSAVKHSPTVAAVGSDGELRIKPRESASQPNLLHPRRSEDIRDGGLLSQGSSSEGLGKLPIDSGDRAKPSATSQSEESPAVILQNLMEKFIFLKEKGGKAEAFKGLQKSFAMNASILSPYFIPLKDLMNLIMELETFIGKSGEHIGKTPEQVIRQFLNTSKIGDDSINSPYQKSLDKTS